MHRLGDVTDDVRQVSESLARRTLAAGLETTLRASEPNRGGLVGAAVGGAPAVEEVPPGAAGVIDPVFGVGSSVARSATRTRTHEASPRVARIAFFKIQSCVPYELGPFRPFDQPAAGVTDPMNSAPLQGNR